MTTQQLQVFNCVYLVVLVVVAILTRATALRIAGALAGGLVIGVMALGIISIGERVGWWHMAITWEPSFLTVMLISFTVCAFIFLITWRIARRFGWRGLAVLLVILAFFGPMRDHWYMRRFPEWGSYGAGFAPILAISASYVILVLVGHGVMRLVAGPSHADKLAQRPWEAAER